MIKVICDICGKVLPDKGEKTVNLDFNSYLIAGSRLKNDSDREYNLCVYCANELYDTIQVMKAQHEQERKLIEGEQE